MQIEQIAPADIEKKSFEMIEEELLQMDIELPAAYKPIIKRAIHTSADFDYATNLCFSEDALEAAKKAIAAGGTIVTDTQMAYAGINKMALKKAGMKAISYMQDERAIELAKETGNTRSAACMDLSMEQSGAVIYAIGNAPTALIRLKELYDTKGLRPALIIGVPVGFVNVVQAKELIMEMDVPYIVAKGRKGGSNIAAAICNALLYEYSGRANI